MLKYKCELLNRAHFNVYTSKIGVHSALIRSSRIGNELLAHEITYSLSVTTSFDLIPDETVNFQRF